MSKSNAAPRATAILVGSAILLASGIAFFLGGFVDLPETLGNKGGLGLATMKERALAQGWDLSLASRPGQGTSVRITAEVKT